MRQHIVVVDGVTRSPLRLGGGILERVRGPVMSEVSEVPEVRAVVLLMGLVVSSLLVYLLLTEVSRSVSKSHDPQPDKFPKANVTAVDH